MLLYGTCAICPREKDGYGNEVPRLARPLPVEYLLVDIPASTPLTPLFTFYADANVRPFPVENRMVDGHIQDFSALSVYMQQFTPDCFLNAVSDFHFLLYISQMDMLPMKDYMGPILEAVRTQNSEQAQDWSHSEHWATVEQLIAASLSSPPQSRPQSVAFAEMGAIGGGAGGGGGGSGSGGGLGTVGSDSGLGRGSDNSGAGQIGPESLWTCPHCTYLNSPELISCEMCSLPR
ncbi:Nuclear protein localization protein 4 [Blattella germanica]|nr:Nuclear protein localization protein 4 [Blattella germanica]